MISQITPDGVKPREPRHVDRRFGMPGADQHAAVACYQREDVARRDDVLAMLGRVDRDRHGARAVVGGDAGGHPLARFDRDGEGGFVPGAVVAAHQVEAEQVDAILGHREADEAAAVLGHEVDRVGGRHLRRDDKVAFIFAILVIDQDEHAAVARFLDDLLDRDERGALFALGQVAFELPESVGGRVPFLLVEAAQRIGVEPGGAGKPGAGNPARGDEIADAIDQHRAHDSADITL